MSREADLYRFAQEGKLKLLTELFSGVFLFSSPPEVNYKDPNSGLSVLAAAAKGGHKEIVNYLMLQHNAHITEVEILASLPEHPDIALDLLLHKVKSANFNAVFTSQVFNIWPANAIESLVQALPANEKNELMKLAVKNGQLACVQLLLQAGVSPELRIKTTTNILKSLKLQYSRFNYSYTVGGRCFDEYLREEPPVEFSGTLLHSAASQGHYEIVKALLDAGAYSMPLAATTLGIGIKPFFTKPVFFTFSNNVSVELVKLFLNHIYTLPKNSTERYNGTDLHRLSILALKLQKIDPQAEMFIFIQDYKEKAGFSNSLSEIEECITNMAASGHTALLQQWIEQHQLDIDLRSNGSTLLHLACQNGYLDVAKFLVTNGADVNARTRDNEFLIDHADLFISQVKEYAEKEFSERTPLQRAISSPFSPIEIKISLVRYLLSLTNPKVNVNAQDFNGKTALHLAQKLNSWQIYDLLIKAGAKATISDVNGKFPLSPQRPAATNDVYVESTPHMIQIETNVLSDTKGKRPVGEIPVVTAPVPSAPNEADLLPAHAVSSQVLPIIQAHHSDTPQNTGVNNSLLLDFDAPEPQTAAIIEPIGFKKQGLDIIDPHQIHPQTTYEKVINTFRGGRRPEQASSSKELEMVDFFLGDPGFDVPSTPPVPNTKTLQAAMKQ